MRKPIFLLVLILIAAATVALSLSRTVAAPESVAVDFDSDRWVVEDPKAKKEEFLGRKSLFLSQNGFAHLKDLDFEDGTVEVDIAAMPVAFPGVTFRFESKEAHELVYLRPHHSGHDDATQYVPAFQGSHPWQIYNGPGYTAAAVIPDGKWLHMKIEVRGLTAKVFLGDAREPILTITDLKRGYSKGSIGITSGAQGAHFSNFSYTPQTAAAHTPAQYPALAAGILTNWELSESLPTATTNAEVLPSLKTMKWERVATEYPGMVVIDRYRRSPSFVPPFAFDSKVRLQPSKETRTVFARTNINSDRDQSVRMSFGYSDEATVFLNGQPLFNGKSAWRYRDQDFNGVMDVEDDAVYLPLKRGRNELILAVTEYFGGWGFICRLDSSAGLKLKDTE